MSPRVQEPIETVTAVRTLMDIMLADHIDMPTTVQAIIVKAVSPRGANLMITVDGRTCGTITASVVDATERDRI